MTTDNIYQGNPWAQQAYEGASFDYKNNLRGIVQGEVDQLTARELRFLQLRSRNITSNNAYGVSALATNLTKQGVITTDWKDSKGKSHSYMNDVWGEFWENPSHDGYGDYGTFQALGNSELFINGANFIRKLIIRTGNVNKVPFKLQLIPTCLHAMEVSYGKDPSDATDNVIRYGIKFNKSGLPVSYYFNKSYIEKQVNLFDPTIHVEVPATELVHYFQRDYAGQWLGVPKLTSVLLSLYELEDLIGATVQKQKISQAVAFVVQNATDSLNQYPTAIASSVSEDYVGDKKQVVFHTRGTNTLYLNRGESAQLMQSNDIGANWGVLVETELRKVAIVSEILLHELTGETGKMSMSAMIGLLVQSRKRLEYIINVYTIPLREKPIVQAFQQVASVYNKRAASAVAHFQLPMWRGLDDLADAQADVLELQNGLALYEDKLAERGLTIDKVIADRESLKELEKYGIQFAALNAQPSMQQAGANQQANSNTTSN